MSTRVTELLEKTGLNWNVRTEGITTDSGIILDGYKAIVRDDTNVPLSVRSDEYYPYQNSELVELLDKVSGQTGLEIHGGGSFKEGARVFIQLKSNDMRLGNDKIEGYLTGINSFDGSTSMALDLVTSLLVVKTNSSAFRELQSKVRHTKNMIVRVDEICRSLENVLEEEKKVFESIKRLSETSFDDIIKDRVTKNLFNIKPEVDLKDEDSFTRITQNRLSRFYVDLNGELQQKGDNLWGLFSGITKYTTHSLSKDSTESKMFGSYGRKELSIFNELVELV